MGEARPVRGGQRVELLGGEVVEMTPIVWIVDLVARVIEVAIHPEPEGHRQLAPRRRW